MNKTVAFLLGAGIGSVATYFVTKRIIEQRADEEIESVVTTFKERFDKVSEVLTDEQREQLDIYVPAKEEGITFKEEPKIIPQKGPYPTPERNETQKEYEEKMNDLGYSVGVDLSEEKDQSAESIVNLGSAPYVITEDDFGEFGNDEETLILYADNVLATEDDEVITDVEELLGDCLNEFGKYDERLYVRNQEREIDYIILRSEKMYKDIAPEVVD